MFHLSRLKVRKEPLIQRAYRVGSVTFTVMITRIEVCFNVHITITKYHQRTRRHPSDYLFF